MVILIILSLLGLAVVIGGLMLSEAKEIDTIDDEEYEPT
jgi:hypothetical protein